MQLLEHIKEKFTAQKVNESRCIGDSLLGGHIIFFPRVTISKYFILTPLTRAFIVKELIMSVQSAVE